MRTRGRRVSKRLRDILGSAANVRVCDRRHIYGRYPLTSFACTQCSSALSSRWLSLCWSSVHPVSVAHRVAPQRSCSRDSETTLDSSQRHFDLNPYPGKPKVTFAPDGSFKLLVFSDLHFGENAWDAWGPEQDVNSTRLMRRVLADEQPDYV